MEWIILYYNYLETCPELILTELLITLYLSGLLFLLLLIPFLFKYKIIIITIIKLNKNIPIIAMIPAIGGFS